jgi:HEAT repeat protein
LRRTLLGLAVTGSLLIGFFLVYFSVSGFRTTNQSYLTALSDFCFMAESYQRQAFNTPLELDDASFAAVTQRLRAGTHWEVRNRAHWTLARWGLDVGPRLLAASERVTDPYQQVGIARALAAIHHPQAATITSTYLARYLDDLRRFRSDFIDILGETADPESLTILIPIHQRYGNSLGAVEEAIGRCGGTAYLLAELSKATTPEAIRSLIWPLVYTRDLRGISAVARQLLHPDEKVRVRAFSALGQSTGSEAVAPLLKVLQTTQNEYILSSAINMVLARRGNRGAPGLVPYLAGLIDHPTLSWDARYALARIGGPEAVAVLQAMTTWEKPEVVMEHLDILGETALPLLQQYLQHPEPQVRRQALDTTEALLDPATRPALTPLLNDPDPFLRKRVRQALFELDNLALLRSFTDILPEPAGQTAWRGFRFDMSWGFRQGYREALKTLSLVHWTGLAISGLLGLLLIFNRVRIFESYRFCLFVTFLLAEGLMGNCFFLGRGFNRPEQVFRFATGVLLLLLIGFLFQERERLPGELRSRFERLGGASLWLLTPPLLYYATPLIAAGLRLVLQDFFSFIPYLSMAAIAVVLVIEQWALPWRLFPRRARLERLQGGLLATLMLGLFCWPLLLVLLQRLADGDQNGALFAGVLIAPLIWLLVFHLAHIGLLRPGGRTGTIPPAPGRRFIAIADGDRISVRLRRPRNLKRLMLQCCLVLAVGGLTAFRVGQLRGGMGGLVLTLVAGLLGAALAGFLFEALAPRLLLQLRSGLVRSGLTRFGFTLSAGDWRRQPHLTSAMKQRLALGDTNAALTLAERDWLLSLRDSSVAVAKGRPVSTKSRRTA